MAWRDNGQLIGLDEDRLTSMSHGRILFVLWKRGVTSCFVLPRIEKSLRVMMATNANFDLLCSFFAPTPYTFVYTTVHGREGISALVPGYKDQRKAKGSPPNNVLR